MAYLGLAFGYATLTPIWQNPDEPAHFNYVAYVARTGGLPELRSGDWDSGLLERLKNGALQPADDVAAIRYESWQPPLFYLLAAPIYRVAAPSDRLSVSLPPAAAADLAPTVFRLRALDVVLGALTLVAAYFVAREVFPERLAFGVPLAMVGVPMFTSVSAAISADPLANLLSTVVLFCLVSRIRHGTCANGRWSIGTGALLGLGLLTKLAVAIFGPIALGVILLRSTRPVREAALLCVVAALVVAPWMVHQVTTYGPFDPLATSRHAAVVLDQQRFPGLSVDYLRQFATITFHSFWAQFGWMGIVAPDRLYWAYGLWLAVGASGLWIARRQLAAPAWRLLLLTVAAAVVALIGYNLSFEQFQGRYLFTALVPIAALLVLGWAAWLPRSAQSWGVLLLGVVLLGLNAYALTRVLVPGFAPVG